LDHAGGAALVYEKFGVRVYGSRETARRVSQGDEDSIALPEARRSGLYRASDTLRPCPVCAINGGPAVLEIGDVTIEAIATPGHAADHTAYLTSVNGLRILFAGDLLFPDGQVALLNTHDCCSRQLVKSLDALRSVDFDALLAGHLVPRMANATQDRDAALSALDHLVLPRSIV
jgi:glyoxylase-like metal-dependent hydrolase (beta-lactamase superfamily II)